MARPPVPTSALVALDLMRRIIDGNERHKAVKPIPPDVLSALAEAVKAFADVVDRLAKTKAVYTETRQSFNEIRKTARKALRKARNVVLGLYDEDDKAIEDYGLSTPVKHVRSTAEGKKNA